MMPARDEEDRPEEKRTRLLIVVGRYGDVDYRQMRVENSIETAHVGQSQTRTSRQLRSQKKQIPHVSRSETAIIETRFLQMSEALFTVVV